ncbi:MAG: trypsin-like peptidase domain-containing protein [Clostridia bacterium]|nr:trypsin-like peptidase domain-containing protein [Clostridia bacterium]
MYKYKKASKGTFKNLITIFGIMILTAIISISMYKIYEGIEIDTYMVQAYEAEKTIATVEDKKKKGSEVADVVENVTSCVVGISKIKNTGNTIFLKDSATSLGLGTGIIVSENGYILSNQHVTGDKYTNCYITLENGRTYTANVVWADNGLDLSISKITAKNLPYVTFGDSENIRVGEEVYAIGNPIGFEFQRTVTSGIVSAVNRTVRIDENDTSVYMENLIQTDATINPGNSGGPLINLDGNVIGVTSVKITSAEGIGFAVPINIVKPIIESFLKEDKFDEANLGIFAYDKEIIPYLEEKIDNVKGIYVGQVALDSPAYKSGIKIGDKITKIDNLELNKMCDLRCYIYSKKPGDEVTLNIIRNGKEEKIGVILGGR